MTNLITICLALAAYLPGQTEGGARVAVVNVPVISEKYDKTRDLEADFEGVRRRLNEQRDALRDRVERLNRSLQEELKPGTEEYRARRKELAMADAELKWFLDSESLRIEQGLADSLQEIYKDIHAAVREVAQERGIDIVLATDQLPETAPESAGQVRQQILLQKVLYWNPRLEITDDVISRLNRNYEASRKKKP